MKKRILGCLILLTATRSRAEIPLESNVVRDLFSHRNQAPSALVLKRQIIDLAVERGLLDPARLPLYAAPGLKTFLPDFEERLDVDVFMALLQKPEMQPERERIELFVEDLISLYTTWHEDSPSTIYFPHLAEPYAAWWLSLGGIAHSPPEIPHEDYLNSNARNFTLAYPRFLLGLLLPRNFLTGTFHPREPELLAEDFQTVGDHLHEIEILENLRPGRILKIKAWLEKLRTDPFLLIKYEIFQELSPEDYRLLARALRVVEQQHAETSMARIRSFSWTPSGELGRAMREMAAMAEYAQREGQNPLGHFQADQSFERMPTLWSRCEAVALRVYRRLRRWLPAGR